MITLITGAPGSGKTLYCIHKIIQPLVGTHVIGQDEDGGTVIYDRRIYTNINGLLLDHEFVDKDWLDNLHDNKTTGAVVVFDEVQRVWPNRPHGSKKPPAVEYLETHRHDGIDVVLLTQNPQLLDPAVRALVGRHLHMRRFGAFGAAVVYEWDACSNALNFKSAFTKHPYRYSRKVYKLYKSAKVHTKQTRRLPFAVYVAVAGVIGAIYAWPALLGRVTGKEDAPAAHAVDAPSTASMMRAAHTPGSIGQMGKQAPMTAHEYIESHRPRMDGLPHTAPRYDDLTKPTRVQYPAACMQSKSQGCKCYNQDGQRIWIADSMCRDIVKDGLFLDFNPDPQKQQQWQQPVLAGAVQWTPDEPIQVPPAARPQGISMADVAAAYRGPPMGRVEPSLRP
ncbi:MAG: zonular occludens toxin domain-containing protein [Pseudomonadota bacterium]|nr:zonular occludens toxin domain-containing protein [Pseudomonadota bacterium]